EANRGGAENQAKAAAEAGFEAGDVILKIGDERIASFEEIAKLRDYLQGLDDEDGLFTVRRGEETLEIETRPKVLDQDRVELKRPKELGYDVSPGLVVARNRGGNVLEIQTRGVGTLRLHLAEPMIDFSKELVVRVNGKERFRGTPPQDAAVMLAEAVLNVPGGPLYRGTLDVDLSKSK
ncbi:MAG: PDZ domain-containing protein, partial [Planctomycetota bacterium]